MKETNRGRMNECYNMVTYDQWSYMTLLVTLQIVFTTLDGGIQIDRLFVAFEKPRGTGELAGKVLTYIRL